MSEKSLLAQKETLEKIAKKKPLAISILIMASLLFAMIIGFGMGLLGSFIYLIVIFPIMSGFILGHLIYRNALDLKIKQRVWLVIISLLSAFVLYGMYQYGRYFTFQAIATYELFGGFSDKEINVAKQIVEHMLIEETGRGGFFGYLFLISQEGVSIGKIISSSKLTLTGWGVWLYWLAEFSLIAYFTTSTTKDAINPKEPEKVEENETHNDKPANPALS